MSTVLQQKLAKAVVENTKAKKPKNKKDLLVSVGYGVVTATAQPGVILEQKGVQDELKKLGFSEEGAKKVVEEILYNPLADNGSRLRAAGEVFKVFGSYAAEKSFNMTVNASVEEINEVIKKDLAKFRPNK